MKKNIDPAIMIVAYSLARKEVRKKESENYEKAKNEKIIEYKKRNFVYKLFFDMKLPDLFLYYGRLHVTRKDIEKFLIQAEKETKKIRRIARAKRCSKCGMKLKSKLSDCWFEDETLYIASDYDDHYKSDNPTNCKYYIKKKKKCDVCEDCKESCMCEMQDRRSMYFSR